MQMPHTFPCCSHLFDLTVRTAIRQPPTAGCRTKNRRREPEEAVYLHAKVFGSTEHGEAQRRPQPTSSRVSQHKCSEQITAKSQLCQFKNRDSEHALKKSERQPQIASRRGPPFLNP